jgi:hypothetical protein
MSDLELISTHLIKIKKQFSIVNDSYKVIDIWENIVGEQFSKNTSVKKYSNRILYVSVRTNAWLNQINFFKNEIINKYNKHFEKEVIKDIKFSLNKNDSTSNKDTISVNYKTKINENLNIKSLSKEDKKFISKCICSIEDKELRNKLEKFFSIIRLRELTLINNGWKKCKKCLNIFKGEKCTFCKY